MLNLIENSEEILLTNEIISGKKDILNIDNNDIKTILNLSTKLPINKSSEILKKVLGPLVPSYQYSDKHPYWFDQGTSFSSNIWKITIGSWKKCIDFNVKINGSEKLTDRHNRKLLNTFKKWIVIQGNPFYNGGKILKPTTVKRKIVITINLIDVILSISDEIDLPSRHMKAVNKDLVIDILSRLDDGLDIGLFRFNVKLTNYLLYNIKNISDEEASIFLNKYPYLKYPLIDSEKNLELTQDQRIKSCCFLFKVGAYIKSKNNEIRVSPSSTFFSKIFYKNTLLSKELATNSIINDLCITPPEVLKEYKSIPVRNENENAVSCANLNDYYQCFKSVSIISGDSFSEVPPNTFSKSTLPLIKSQLNLKQAGRFTTLPARVVFTEIRNSFEFIFKYMDEILDSIFNIINNKPTKKPGQNNKKYLSSYKKIGFMEFVPESLSTLGIKRWVVSDYADNRFELRRANIGLHDLYTILISSIMIIIGSTVARRQAEIINIDPIDCLLPRQIEPSKNINFEIIFDNCKSGSGGPNPIRETLSKPILSSVAGIIYKLQLFNKKLLKNNLIAKEKLSLISTINPHNLTFNRFSPPMYNKYLNMYCDYFQTETVKYNITDTRRYYIRQHQLRRFFAILFFWSKGYDGLDTLRQFLAHTNSEHLYHYITEATPGEVLSEVKAKRIIDGVHDNDIKNIEKLKDVLLARYGSKSIVFKTYSQLINDYEEDIDDKYIESAPCFDIVKEKFKENSILLEDAIISLFENKLIDLNPEFFTVKDSLGEIITDYRLIINITEVNNDDT